MTAQTHALPVAIAVITALVASQKALSRTAKVSLETWSVIALSIKLRHLIQGASAPLETAARAIPMRDIYV
jgi:hypothetical protein